MISMSFLGAARNVTGSCYLLELDGKRIIVDCGMYQERQFKGRNWEEFAVPPSSIDAVLLTHAHLDHCGLLPKLVKEGFEGKVFCTAATGDIARIVLMDAGHIQEEDAKKKKRRHEREGRQGPYPELPLYTVQDAEACADRFRHVKYGDTTQIVNGVSAVFNDVGHILGSSTVSVTLQDAEKERTVVFSGDVGRRDTPLLEDPTRPAKADYVVMESTYGNRDHGPRVEIPGELENVVNATFQRGGKLVIPAFSVERTQELLYYLHGLLVDKRIPKLKAFVDSPMAIRVTEVFRRHPELFDDETMALINKGEHPCDFPGLEMTRSVEESKAINDYKGPAVIIAGSGMCTGGRIKHHLVNNIGLEESTILFIGYQAIGTLGRIILDGADRIRLFGQEHPVRAQIAQIHGFSAHADRTELIDWISGLTDPPKKVFVTHGEEDAATAFGAQLKREKGWPVLVPEYRDKVELG